MLTVHARIQEIPPDNTGTHDLELRDLTAEAATYEAATASLANRLPDGWRMLFLLVDRPLPDPTTP